MIPPVDGEGRLKTPDGRTLAYVERGAADGTPLIVCHGTPGSRVARHPDLEIYERHGVRAVMYDRPGYGDSDPQEGRSVGDAAADVAAIADELGFDRFAVVGGSGGAPHSLACGALLGERVIRVGAIVTPAPSDTDDFDFFDGLAEINVKEFGAALEGKEAIEQHLQPYADQLRSDPEGVIEELAAELPEVDKAILAKPAFREIFVASFVESVRQGARGWADDDLAFAKSWGFALEDVQVETRVWQGELDVLAPRSHGEYVGSKLPNARFELLEGGGHFLDDAWPVVLDWLAAPAHADTAP